MGKTRMVVLAAALAGAVATWTAAPASAGSVGPCNGTVDVACSDGGTGCTLYYNGDCVIG